MISDGINWEAECRRLQQFSSHQSDVITQLETYADAVEALREIGQLVGCDHVGDADGRRQLVTCVEQTLSNLRRELQTYKDCAAEHSRWARAHLEDASQRTAEFYASQDDD